MKKRNLLILACGALLAGATLTACASNQSTSSSKPQSVEDVKTVAFIQLANEDKEYIWYDIHDSNEDDQISKDDGIDTIYITKKGKIDTFFVRELTLSDLKGKNNDEIKKIAKEQDKTSFKVEKEEVISSLGKIEEVANFYKEHIALWERTQEYITAHPEEYTNPDEELRKASDEIERIKEEQTRSEKSLTELEKLTYGKLSAQYLNKPVKAKVETDSTGNTVVEEALEFWSYSIDPDYGEVKVESHSKNFTTTISGVVYDTYYVGYVNPSRGVSGDSFLVTAVPNESVLIVFDTLDTKNVTEE